MFVVLSFECSKRGIKAYFKKKRGYNEIVRLPLGDSFFYNICHHCRNTSSIKWKKIEKAVGREAASLLIPVGINPPENSGIKRYNTEKFARDALTDMFCEILRTAAHPVGRIALIDASGIYTEIAERLLNLAGQLIVYTKAVEMYDDFSDRATLEYGTAPVVSSDPASTEKAAIVLAPIGVEDAFIPFRTPVLGPSGRGDYFIGEDSIVLPPDFEEVMPAGASKLEFLAAACERCEARLDTGQFCKFLCKNGGKSSTKDVILTISCLT